MTSGVFDSREVMELLLKPGTLLRLDPVVGIFRCPFLGAFAEMVQQTRANSSFPHGHPEFGSAVVKPE